MSFVKKVFHQALKCYYYVFPLAAFLIPLSFFSHVSDNYYPSNYQYFICSIIFSLGWFCVILCKERQLKAAASQLLQAKIRKIMEQDEGLRKVCASVEENRRESLQLRARNQELSSQLLLARNAFIKTKTEFQQLEGLISQLKEENQCLHLQLDALSQECGEKDREGQRLHRELTDALAYQQILNEEYQATFEEQHNMLDMRQAYIAKLESKVQDLMCEIRNLLQLDATALENFPKQSLPSFKDLPNQLLLELKKIAFKAENTEAASSLTASRYIRSESSVRNYSLECRQLFDSLREENFGMLFVYAPKSKRAVFANSLFKVWTGHGVEDFFTMDEDLVVSGLSQWEADLCMQNGKERAGKLVIKTKNRGHTPFYYCLTVLNKGPLHSHVLGVLHPVHKDIV